MIVRVVSLVVFLVVVAGALLVHFRQQSMVSGEPPGGAANTNDIPRPPAKGPYAKAVVDGVLVHDFGTMEQGQHGEHVFTIRNEGQAPLRMVARDAKEDHSCQCTLGKLGKSGLQPGESTSVTLTWEIKAPVTQFQHWAKVRTNDPDNLEMMFRVQGLVGKRLAVKPGTDINVGTLTEGKPTIQTVTVYSEVQDSFQITKLELSSPRMQVESRPLDADELRNLNRDPAAERMQAEMKATADLKNRAEKANKEAGIKTPADQNASAEIPDLAGKAPEPKCGYELKVLFLSGFPIGRFHETLSIQTDVQQVPAMTVSFGGHRNGPVDILLATPGTAWSSEQALLRLGRFPAKEGKKVKLIVIISKGEQELQITDAKFDPPTMKYQITKDDKFVGAGRDKFDLVLEVPPSDTPLTLGAQNPGSIVLQTNHPNANAIKMDLEFTSFLPPRR